MGRWSIGELGRGGIGVLGKWGMGGCFSLLDAPFLFYFGESKLLSMPVFAWFVGHLMHDAMVKVALLAKFTT